MQTEDSQKVIKRFFEALRYLKDEKIIRGKQTFTRAHEINRWNMNTLEKDPHGTSFRRRGSHTLSMTTAFQPHGS